MSNLPLPTVCMPTYVVSNIDRQDNLYRVSLYTEGQTISEGFSGYDGFNVKVGMWFSNVDQAFSWKIVQIISQGSSSLELWMEDVDYMNSQFDARGGGIDPPIGNTTTNKGYIFELSTDGLPLLAPTNPDVQTGSWVTDQISRFRMRNFYKEFFRVNQPSHTFEIGNFIYLTSTGSYQLSTSSTTDIYTTIGVVTSIGIPTGSAFTYRPFGQYLTYDKIFPSLTGPDS